MTMLNQALLQRANACEPLPGLGSEINGLKNLKKCVFDFSIQGGAIGTLGLLDDLGNPVSFPVGAIITRTFVNVITAVTSAGSATVALTIATAADVLAATAKASLGIGLSEGIQDGTVTHMIGPTTVAKTLSAVVAVAALTAGKFEVFVEYVIQ